MADESIQLALQLQEKSTQVEITDIQVLFAQRTGRLDLRTLNAKRARDYYAKKRAQAYYIDLCGIADGLLIKEAVGWLNHLWEDTNVQPYNIHQSFVSPLRNLMPHIHESGYKSLREISYEDVASVFDVAYRAKNFHRRLRRYLEVLDDTTGGLALDVWELKELITDRNRFNPSDACRRISFEKIANDVNRQLAKGFILHLINETNLSISTIRLALDTVKMFCAYLGDLRIVECDRSVICDYEAYLKSRYSNRIVANLKIMQTKKLLDWLVDVGSIENNEIRNSDTYQNAFYQYKETAVDDYVVDQIFKSISTGDIPPRPALWFTILYCTGMRASEACSLRCDCVYREGDSSFIRYYSEKMEKRCASVIPEELHSAIDEYKRSAVYREGLYLFQSHRSEMPVKYVTMIKQFSKALNPCSIKNPDGSPYVFRAHDYRHTMAIDILDSGAPFHTVQTQLHHKSARMTTVYTEMLPKRKKSMVQKVVDAHGQEMPLPESLSLPYEDITDWLRNRLNPQILTNGICGKPIELGSCQHAYACLECPDFRTSVEYLDIHQEQLERLINQRDLASSHGYTQEFARAERAIGKLESIILALSEDS